MRQHYRYVMKPRRSYFSLQSWQTFVLLVVVVLGLGGFIAHRIANGSAQAANTGTSQTVASVVATPYIPRVGVQVGHWKAAELPDELTNLSWNFGASAGGYNEWEINYDIAERVAALLQAKGIIVDILPATIPPDYTADAFISLHADGNEYSYVSGFKVAASDFDLTSSSMELATALESAYAAASGLEINPTITEDMTEYYAFNYHKFVHSVSKKTPAVLLELGFITNANDRKVMTQRQPVLADAIANTLYNFVSEEKQ